MTRVLFINPVQPRCGVHQYGLRLFDIMKMSKELECTYQVCPAEIEIGSLYFYDVVIYNVHPGISNAMHNAPFPCSVKQIAIYHDGPMNGPFDRWLLSDSSAPGYGNLTTIGRPLPEWDVLPHGDLSGPVKIGLSGLVGAWAADMVRFVAANMPLALIRLHLAPSDHCDPSGALARAVGQACLNLGNPRLVEVDYEFKPQAEVLEWLSANDLNCFIRSTGSGPMGVSSALDMALAVGRPIAVNNNPMFRHITRVSPEIMVENTPLREIIAMGPNPLIPHWRRNSRRAVMEELENVIHSVIDSEKAIIENRGQ
jgi:hypothetical protein